MMPRVKPSYSDLTDCPVCTDQYKDPRLLSCGHHFCLVCLQKIAEDSDVIICPTCRYQTEKPVDMLKKYKFNEFEISANIFTSKDEFTCKLCSSCSKYIGKTSCMDCRMIFCNDCKDVHKIIGTKRKHRLSPVSKYQFCKKHLDQFIISVCKDCDNIGCCFSCMRDHRDHKLEDVQALAQVKRAKLDEQAKTMEPVNKDEKFLKEIQKKCQSLQKVQKDLATSKVNITAYLANLTEKMQYVQQQTEETVKAEIKKLEFIEWDLAKFISSKKKMTETLKNLQENLSDADVVFRSHDYPKYTSSSCFTLLETGTVQVPNISKIRKAEKQIAKVAQNIETHVTSESFKGMPLRNLNKVSPFYSRTLANMTIKEYLRARIVGMLCHPITKNLILLTESDVTPLKIFNSSGKLLGSLGQNNDEICDNILSQIGLAYDSKRRLYLLYCWVGKLLRLTENNVVKDYVTPSAFLIKAECVAVDDEGENYYIMEKDKVHIVDPDQRKKDWQFSVKEYGTACVMACASDRDSKKTVIVIGFYDPSWVRMFSPKGEMLRSFDISMGLKNPAKPEAISFDPDGIIIVLDTGNKWVASFWMEDGKTRSELLIKEGQLSEETSIHEASHLAIDSENRVLYIGYRGGSVDKYTECL